MGGMPLPDFPAPLVSDDVDLSDFAFMPLDVQRLLTSETWVLGNAAEKVAALTLWLVSWHQTPAASLPDNDKMLAHLSQAGSGWKKVKDHALRGWVRCSDGRIYHPVVAEKANEAWEKKQKQRERSRTGNATRWGNGIPEGSHKDPIRIPQGCDMESPNDPKGQGPGLKKEQQQGIDLSDAPPGNEWVRIGSAWLTEIGADPSGCMDFSTIGAWLNAGFTEAEIMATAPILRARGKAPRHPLGYFRTAVPDEIAKARAIARPTETGAMPRPGDQWRHRVAGFKRAGNWQPQIWGPAPDRPETEVPAEILAEFGIGERVPA